MQRHQKDTIAVYAFIDSQNLNLGVKRQGWQLDFKKFYKYLIDQHNVRIAYIFIGFVPKNRKLYNYLRNIGYHLIFKPTLTYRNRQETKTKGNVDAELVLHAMLNYSKYTHALIVTGDGDFYCLLEYLNSEKKLYKLIIPNKKSYSVLLKYFMGKIVFVSDLKRKVESA